MNTTVTNQVRCISRYILPILFLPLGLALADASSDGERGISLYRQGRLIEAMQLLSQSAEQGYVPAQVTLAYIYDQSEENDRAFELYRQAASSGSPEGLFGLGSLYLKGEGTEADPKKAGQLILQAAQLDHLQAMRVIAYAYESGQLGLDMSQPEAARWFTLAAEAGDQVSMSRLVQAHTRGELGLAIDPAQAARWNERLIAK